MGEKEEGGFGDLPLGFYIMEQSIHDFTKQTGRHNVIFRNHYSNSKKRKLENVKHQYRHSKLKYTLIMIPFSIFFLSLCTTSNCTVYLCCQLQRLTMW